MASTTTNDAANAALIDATFAPPAETSKKTKTPKTPRWTPMTAAEAKAAADVARPALAPCLCGCGTLTKGRFAPGHDATHHARLDATVAKGGPAAAHAQRALDAFGWTRPAKKAS